MPAAGAGEIDQLCFEAQTKLVIGGWCFVDRLLKRADRCVEVACDDLASAKRKSELGALARLAANAHRLIEMFGPGGVAKPTLDNPKTAQYPQPVLSPGRFTQRSTQVHRGRRCHPAAKRSICRLQQYVDRPALPGGLAGEQVHADRVNISVVVCEDPCCAAVQLRALTPGQVGIHGRTHHRVNEP